MYYLKLVTSNLSIRPIVVLDLGDWVLSLSLLNLTLNLARGFL